MELPPVLKMLTVEMLSGKHLRDRVRKLLNDRGFLKEISTQAEYSMNGNGSLMDQEGLRSDGLNIYPTAALNPLARFGKCNQHDCRITHAESFARSIGLYCDNATLTDFVTEQFVGAEVGKINPRDISADLQAITVLMPMIKAGIIRFSSPIASSFCGTCAKKATGDISEKIWKLVLKDGTAEFLPDDGGRYSVMISSKLFMVDGGPLTSEFEIDAKERGAVPQLFRAFKIKTLPPKTLKLVKKKTTDKLALRALLVSEEAKSAADKSVVLVTNSREDATILKSVNNGAPLRSFDDWEKLRSVRLPWVSNLSVQEIIRLREKAGSALPKFRDRMNRELFATSPEIDQEKQSLEVAKRLREEANELDAELIVAARKTGHTGHILLGAAGLSCVIYGLHSGNPTAINVGGPLLAALATMYHPSKNARSEHEFLKTKPAYVLLTAREIISGR